jgi:hypothetical protein
MYDDYVENKPEMTFRVKYTCYNCNSSFWVEHEKGYVVGSKQLGCKICDFYLIIPIQREPINKEYKNTDELNTKKDKNDFTKMLWGNYL